ncbi:MAG: DUF721 domain-containing protein [Truepera sp.]|nr:DUF721 domain-containing protein [Truepera sp.]
MSRDSGHVADLLAKVFKWGGMKRAVRRAEAVLLWPQVAGPELAAFTRGRSLKDGILYVDVPDSETSMHLSLQRGRFLEAYRNRFGIRDVRDVRFRAGRGAFGGREDVGGSEVREVAVDPQALSRLAHRIGELDLPEELVRPAMQAARSMLAYRARKEAEGWVPCPLCDSLSEMPELCETCQRYAGEVRVQRASKVLMVDPDSPTPHLSDEECAVARYLAQADLEDRLTELLPQALADPTFKPHLEAAARCFLAFQLDRLLADIGSDDYDRLPPRIARALGRWG